MTRPHLATICLVVACAVGVCPALGQEARSVQVTGTVVDAACFMIHPDAATAPSHRECADACVARGVPLAIVNEADGQVYFAADGSKRLSPFRYQRVSALGRAVRKTEPLELKMAVGEGGEMTVTVKGGYNVLTIESIAAAPKRSTTPTKPH